MRPRPVRARACLVDRRDGRAVRPCGRSSAQFRPRACAGADPGSSLTLLRRCVGPAVRRRGRAGRRLLGPRRLRVGPRRARPPNAEAWPRLCVARRTGRQRAASSGFPASVAAGKHPAAISSRACADGSRRARNAAARSAASSSSLSRTFRLFRRGGVRCISRLGRGNKKDRRAASAVRWSVSQLAGRCRRCAANPRGCGTSVICSDYGKRASACGRLL